MADDHDQIFLSLPQHVQRRIDKAFEAFVEKTTDSERPKKRRKVANTVSDHDSDLNVASLNTNFGGGFVVDDGDNFMGGGGGFIVDDVGNKDAGGGFVVEEGVGEDTGAGFMIEDTTPSLVDNGGGFLVDDAVGGDGLIPEDQEETSSTALRITDYIPFSSVPSALQFLDLPPDDDQVLSVFKNAASGWNDDHPKSSRSRGSRFAMDVDSEDSEKVGMISREDWRAVCAILLEQQSGFGQSTSEATSSPVSISEPPTRPTTRGSSRRASRGVSLDVNPEILAEDSDDDEDFHQEEDDDDGGEDEYVDPDFTASSSRRRRHAPTRGTTSANAKSRRSRGHNSDSDISEYDSDDEHETTKPKLLTARQKQTCLATFALFFPEAEPDELPQKRIMIKDLQRVAALLKEKIKAEEMVEMLEAFSTQPDKSMSLGDFEKMMITTRLA
ncbi:hypothetical protein K435DRAFT_771788 [Dendrothele bispora CBS 962.96]|uniref:EF-hand domain-containing protein n=1 Tax=Dendrothele bispora (strain CBS 962.96) TaxID=1314807 RepID=A0A4S8N063_DENBC|nr:hypothetical protein K435DRAFT_771788 [Dendrothele bispora CBS 962.96]